MVRPIIRKKGHDTDDDNMPGLIESNSDNESDSDDDPVPDLTCSNDEEDQILNR